MNIPALLPGRFFSRFGGLWTDRDDADDILAARLKEGACTAEDAELLRFWMRNGYVILPGAVSREVVDAAQRDIEAMYAEGRGCVETFESGAAQIVQIDRRFKSTMHKVLDPHGLSEPLRAAALSPKVVHFMNLIFDAPALAFQGLYFERGSEQAMHQDTAFVRVSRPMELAASWLALEDIAEGSGELTYYVGSHRIREHMFDGKDKWMPFGEHEKYLSFIKYLDEECRAMGLKKETFRPKKGDVLIWSADLVHGGSPIAQPGLTRRSFVTHWCPVSAEPAYFSYQNNSGRVKVSDRASYSYYYYGPAMMPPAPASEPIASPSPQGLWGRLKSLFR